MSREPCTLHEIAWQDVIPGFSLLSTLRLSVSVRPLLLSALGVAAMIAGWRICGEMFANSGGPDSGSDPVLQQWIHEFRAWPWESAGSDASGFDPLPSTAHGAASWWASPAPSIRHGPSVWWYASPYYRAWDQLSTPFAMLFQRSTFTVARFVYLFLCGLWALLVWSLLGGAITRLAALSLARDEHVAWGHALAYARSKFVSYFAAPLFPLLGALLTAAGLAVFGLLLHVGIGTVIAGVLWPLVLLAGFFMATLLIGLLLGWPLMWPTISAEGTDSFDALSRSYAYTYQRPLHYLFYATIAIFLGALGWLLVSFFAGAVLDLSNWAVSLGSGARLDALLTRNGDLSRLEQAGSTLIRFWTSCVATVAVGFIYSYFWTASTAIYFLLRKHVDATEADEVYLPEEEETYGMPPLKTDGAGVPGVADDPASAGMQGGGDGVGI